MIKKRLSFLTLTATALIMSSSLLFANGTTEIASGAQVAKVTSITQTDNGYDFGLLTDKDETVFHVNTDTQSVLSPASYRVGDYLTYNDNANTIRYITPLVLNGSVPFEEYQIQIEVPPTDYGTESLKNSFSYAYGSMIGTSMIQNKLTLQGAYFAKGLLDSFDTEGTNLYTTDEMNQFMDTFQNDIYAQGKMPSDSGEDMDMESVQMLTASDNIDDEYSYAYGYLLAMQMSMQGLDIDSQFLAEGAIDSIFSHDSLITDTQKQLALQDYQKVYQAEQKEMFEKVSADNLAASQAFLAANKTNEGVMTMDDGLQYKVLTPADGATPVESDIVSVNYELSDPTGNVIQTTFTTDAPVQMQISQLIPGFREALMQMNVGSTITAWIPPAIGYGEQGSDSIQPNMMLTFKIQLVSIDTAAVEAEQAAAAKAAAEQAAAAPAEEAPAADAE